MKTSDVGCDRICANCAHFEFLDTMPQRLERCFGVCALELERDLGCECATGTMLDWVYEYGRHGQDDCEKPDEWFEEG